MIRHLDSGQSRNCSCFRNRIPLDFAHLNERAKEFNGIEFTKEDFIKMLKERFSKADLKQVKADVLPFVENIHEPDIYRFYVIRKIGLEPITVNIAE